MTESLALLFILISMTGLAQSFPANVGTGVDGYGQSRPIPEVGYTIDATRTPRSLGRKIAKLVCTIRATRSMRAASSVRLLG